MLFPQYEESAVDLWFERSADFAGTERRFLWFDFLNNA